MYDNKNIEKGIIGIKFPSPLHKLMVEELSRVIQADTKKVSQIAECVNKVPVSRIDLITLDELVSSYGLKV
jgi:hypothetical protein